MMLSSFITPRRPTTADSTNSTLSTSTNETTTAQSHRPLLRVTSPIRRSLSSPVLTPAYSGYTTNNLSNRSLSHNLNSGSTKASSSRLFGNLFSWSIKSNYQDVNYLLHIIKADNQAKKPIKDKLENLKETNSNLLNILYLASFCPKNSNSLVDQSIMQDLLLNLNNSIDVNKILNIIRENLLPKLKNKIKDLIRENIPYTSSSQAINVNNIFTNIQQSMLGDNSSLNDEEFTIKEQIIATPHTKTFITQYRALYNLDASTINNQITTLNAILNALQEKI